MKAAELMNSIKEAEAHGAYNGDVWKLYFDLCDGIEEGYIEGINHVSRPIDGNRIRVSCEDTAIWVVNPANTDRFTYVGGNPKSGRRPVRAAGTYERTRAMVYATGNKWAIENFNATH